MTWEWDAGTDNERCFSNIENDTHYQNNQLLYLSEIITHHFPIVLLWTSICFSVPTLLLSLTITRSKIYDASLISMGMYKRNNLI